MLKINELFDLAEFIVQKSGNKDYIDCSLITNGSLINDKIISNLIRYNCRFLQITIDGSEKTHNRTRCFINGNPSYDLLIRNLNLVAEKTIDIDSFKLVLRFNLNNHSESEIKSTLLKIKPNLRKKIQVLFRCVFKTESYKRENLNSNNQIDIFNKLANSLGFRIQNNVRFFSSCEACGDLNTFHILPDLSIWKCINNLKVTKANIGILLEDGSIQWNAQNLLNWYSCADFSNDEKCLYCSMLPDCLGGCILSRITSGVRSCSSFDMLTSSYKYNY